MRVFVIIPAAGLGTRMAAPGKAATSKQFFELGGAPILVHTLRRMASSERVDEMLIALRAAEMGGFEQRLAQEKLRPRVTLVEGGESRQESVAKALEQVRAAPDDVVLVHDGVRPLVDAEMVNNVIAAVEKHGAAIAGVPAIDTIKQVERTADGALITSTIPRERIVLAQTPQGFRYSIIRKAFDDAVRDGFTGTDEASLAERAGFPVEVVMGSYRNLKVTTPGDLELAEFYLKQSL
jgi:2-C-methyl-D-erythritol 4-phosphate cytidylyltransferase